MMKHLLFLIIITFMTKIAVADTTPPLLSPDLCLPFQAELKDRNKQINEYVALVFQQEDLIQELEAEIRNLKQKPAKQ